MAPRSEGDIATSIHEIEPVIEAMTKRVEATFNELSAANEEVSRGRRRCACNLDRASSFVIVSLIAFLSAVRSRGRIKAMTRAMRELANGNFDVVLPGLGRKDEIGAMAQAVDQFKVKAAEKAQREAEEKRNEEERAAERAQGRDDRLADSSRPRSATIVERCRRHRPNSKPAAALSEDRADDTAI